MLARFRLTINCNTRQNRITKQHFQTGAYQCRKLSTNATSQAGRGSRSSQTRAKPSANSSSIGKRVSSHRLTSQAVASGSPFNGSKPNCHAAKPSRCRTNTGFSSARKPCRIINTRSGIRAAIAKRGKHRAISKHSDAIRVSLSGGIKPAQPPFL